MPFGVQSPADVSRISGDVSGISVTNAFRRSVPSGHVSNITINFAGFSHQCLSAFSPQRTAMGIEQTRLTRARHQCLSAFSPQRTKGIGTILGDGIQCHQCLSAFSPQRTRLPTNQPSSAFKCHQCLSAFSPQRTIRTGHKGRMDLPGHQCLSAFSPQRTLLAALATDLITPVTNAFRRSVPSGLLKRRRRSRENKKSPMPFGVQSPADGQQTRIRESLKPVVTNAFRRSVPSGLFLKAT